MRVGMHRLSVSARLENHQQTWSQPKDAVPTSAELLHDTRARHSRVPEAGL